MKLLPRASAMDVERWNTDPVTGIRDVEEFTRFLIEPQLGQIPDGAWEVAYLDGGPEEREIRTVILTGVEQVGGITTGIIEGTDSSVIIRAVEPSDAVDLAPAGVPQPLDVVEAHVIRGGGMLAGEVDAAVAADNSVVTLVLDTGIGLYVRYSGDWQLLPAKSSSLEDLSLHPVHPEALPVYDAADAAAQTLTIFDLPRAIDNYYTDATDREEAEPAPEGPVIAAINNVIDLSNILASAGGRWYVDKRRAALSTREQIGAAQVVASAGNYVRARRDGGNPDPTGLIRRDLIKRARAAGVLNHPVVLAAINWTEWLHPRGRDGTFIVKDGSVDVWDSERPGLGDKSKRAKVKEITKDGVVVSFVDPETGEPTGEEAKVGSKFLSSFNPTARLDGKPLDGGEEEKPGLRQMAPVDTGGEGGGNVHQITATSTPQQPTPEPSAGQLADEVFANATDQEPGISEALAKIVGDTDPENYSAPGHSSGKFYGWEFRLKERDTIEHKIQRWSEKEGVPTTAAAQGINDSLRYTVHYDAATYGERTRSAIVQLVADPEVAKVDIANYWANDRKPYNGVNVEVHRKDGTIYEIQFHTPESQEVKNKQHVLYTEQRRLREGDPKKDQLDDQMHALAAPMKRPEGVDGIVSGVRSKNPDPPGTVALDEGMLKDLLGDKDSTSAKHMVQTENGWEWSPERAALHDAIIEDFLAGKIPVQEGEQPVFSVLGGGPAAGKSTLVNSGLFPALQDPGSVLVNADEIKDRLPEYTTMLNDPDPAVARQAAATVHEESSYLAKRLMNAVYTGNFNVVLDGTGDSSVRAMQKKIDEARGSGYKVNGYYTTVPTEDAWQRANARAKKTGRHVPENILRGTHKSVSKVLPELAEQFDEVGLYDTNTRGQAKPIMSGTKGRTPTIHDEALWAEFLAKADE